MPFKVDENVHPDVVVLLRRHGHDVLTVWEEGLQGRPDAEILRHCSTESRALITSDLGFADIRAYPPERHQGIVVLRVALQSRAVVISVVQRVLAILDTEQLTGCLWVASEAEVRIRGGEP